MNPLLLPIVALQGRWVRSRIELLPEAPGPTDGIMGDSDGSPLRLVVVGESTAAGCGADSHEEAFAGAFARALWRRRGRPVAWKVLGRHGATIRRVRHRMITELSGRADVAVLLIGVNDVLARTPLPRWRDDLAAVLDVLAARAERVVVAGIPPFESFPSLPRLLGQYLAERGRLLDGGARDVCAAWPGVAWVGMDDLGQAEAGFFARDGFHPSPAGYGQWAEATAQRLED